MHYYPSLHLYFTTKQFGDFLFWLHVGIILVGLLMGVFLPLPHVLALVALHRIHLVIFKGCALSKLQTILGHLPEDQNFLQQMLDNLFSVKITRPQARALNNWIGGATLLIAFIHSSLSSNLLALIAIVCALAGVVISLQLWRASKNNDFTQVCNSETFTCEVVSKSPEAYWFGIPVSLAGAAYFSLIAVVIYLTSVVSISPIFLLFPLAFLGAVVSLYFIYAQLGKIKQICSKCMITHVASLSIFMIVGKLVW